MHQNAFALAGLIAAMLLVGCGQSGPLYLPGDPSEIQTPPPQTPPADEDEDDDDGNPQ